MHVTNFKHEIKTRVDSKVERDAERDKAWRECCKAVDARDHRTCRCCERKTNPDDVGLKRGHRHHIVYRSAGGKDVAENVVTLCWECHNDEHKNRLQIVAVTTEQGANGALEFWRKNDDGDWFLSRREIAIGRVERD